jgi:hypothetical protein
MSNTSNRPSDAQPSLSNRIDENGKIIPLEKPEEASDTSEPKYALEGQEHIDYVQGARFWLISISYVYLPTVLCVQVF